jgi:hypothetical protein
MQRWVTAASACAWMLWSTWGHAQSAEPRSAVVPVLKQAESLLAAGQPAEAY